MPIPNHSRMMNSPDSTAEGGVALGRLEGSRVLTLTSAVSFCSQSPTGPAEIAAAASSATASRGRSAGCPAAVSTRLQPATRSEGMSML